MSINWQPIEKDLGRIQGFVGTLKSFFIGEIYSIQQDTLKFFLTSERFGINYTTFDTIEEAKGFANNRLEKFMTDAGMVFGADAIAAKIVRTYKEDMKQGVALPLEQLTIVDLPEDWVTQCSGCYFDGGALLITDCQHPEADDLTPEERGCDVPDEKDQYIINKIFIPKVEATNA